MGFSRVLFRSGSPGSRSELSVTWRRTLAPSFRGSPVPALAPSSFASAYTNPDRVAPLTSPKLNAPLVTRLARLKIGRASCRERGEYLKSDGSADVYNKIAFSFSIHTFLHRKAES